MDEPSLHAACSTEPTEVAAKKTSKRKAKSPQRNKPAQNEIIEKPIVHNDMERNCKNCAKIRLILAMENPPKKQRKVASQEKKKKNEKTNTILVTESNENKCHKICSAPPPSPSSSTTSPVVKNLSKVENLNSVECVKSQWDT